MKLFRFLCLSVCLSLCLTIADAGSQPRAGLPYKVYAVDLTQTGTDAPVETVRQNTLGGTPVWSYETQGRYLLTLVGAFLDGKVPNQYGILNNGGGGLSGAVKKYSINRISDDALRLSVVNENGDLTDELLSSNFFELRVYP